MFFICTLNARKVIFVTFYLNSRLYTVSVCMDVKFLDGSDFLYPNRISVFCTPLILFNTISPCPSETREGTVVNEEDWRESTSHLTSTYIDFNCCLQMVSECLKVTRSMVSVHSCCVYVSVCKCACIW